MNTDDFFNFGARGHEVIHIPLDHQKNISLYTFFLIFALKMHFKGHVDAAEVLEVHVHVIRHVGVGGLLSVGGVPADHESSKP